MERDENGNVICYSDIKFKIHDEHSDLINKMISGEMSSSELLEALNTYAHFPAEEIISKFSNSQLTFDDGVLKGVIKSDPVLTSSIQSVIAHVSDDGRMLMVGEGGEDKLTKYDIVYHELTTRDGEFLSGGIKSHRPYFEKGDLVDLDDTLKKQLTVADLIKYQDSIRGLGEAFDPNKTYQTAFYLTDPVPNEMYKNGDVESQNMINHPYFNDILKYADIDPNDVNHIKWVLQDNQFGYVEVSTNREFTDDELSLMSGLIHDMMVRDVNEVFGKDVTRESGKFDRIANCVLQDVTLWEQRRNDACEVKGPYRVHWGRLDPEKYEQVKDERMQNRVDHAAYGFSTDNKQDGLMDLGNALDELDEENNMEL